MSLASHRPPGNTFNLGSDAINAPSLVDFNAFSTSLTAALAAASRTFVSASSPASQSSGWNTMCHESAWSTSLNTTASSCGFRGGTNP